MTLLVSPEEFGNAQRPCGRIADDNRIGNARALACEQTGDVHGWLRYMIEFKLRHRSISERVVIQDMHLLQARMAPNIRRAEVVRKGGEVLNDIATCRLMEFIGKDAHDSHGSSRS